MFSDAFKFMYIVFCYAFVDNVFMFVSVKTVFNILSVSDGFYSFAYCRNSSLLSFVDCVSADLSSM